MYPRDERGGERSSQRWRRSKEIRGLCCQRLGPSDARCLLEGYCAHAIAFWFNLKTARLSRPPTRSPSCMTRPPSARPICIGSALAARGPREIDWQRDRAPVHAYRPEDHYEDRAHRDATRRRRLAAMDV